MKSILNILRNNKSGDEPRDAGESTFFQTAFNSRESEGEHTVPWEARAVEIDAQRIAGGKGGAMLRALWAQDPHMRFLDSAAMDRLVHFFDFAAVAADREVMRQDEYGSFMVVLLSGSIAVDRVQPWGERLRMSEARPGEVLGEMSLLDGGRRFSDCITLTECRMAVLSAQALDDMMTQQPQLAASLVALLARKLSLRLRAMAERLTDRR